MTVTVRSTERKRAVTMTGKGAQHRNVAMTQLGRRSGRLSYQKTHYANGVKRKGELLWQGSFIIKTGKQGTIQIAIWRAYARRVTKRSTRKREGGKRNDYGEIPGVPEILEKA